MTMIVDLSRQRRVLFQARAGKATMPEGDARDIRLPKRYMGRIAAVITSPPHLNRYDYSRTYALQLCLLRVKTPDDMRSIRHSLLRSHIEVKELPGREVHLAALDEILSAMRRKSLNNDRPPIMMQRCLENMDHDGRVRRRHGSRDSRHSRMPAARWPRGARRRQRPVRRRTRPH